MKTLGVSFLIGAKLGATYEATLGTAERKVKQFDQSIRELERGRGDIERFRALKRGARDTETQLGQAREEVRRLAQEMRQGGQATAGMERRFEAARKRAAGLKGKLAEQQAELHRLRGQLQGAGADTGKLETRYRELGAALDSLKGKQAVLGRIAAEQEKLAARRAELKGQALDMVALGAALFAPVRGAMRLEESMAEVKKVVDFDEPDGLAKLGATLNSMPRKERIPLKPEELAAIAAAGGQLGVAARNLPEFTRTVAKMSTAFDMLPEAAGESAAKIANVWGLPIDRFAVLGDAINHLSNSTAAKAPEMVEVLMRVGGTAKTFGLSAVQAAALGNALIALGKPPEVAATGINALLIKLAAADKQGAAFKTSLKQLGWSAKDLKAAIATDAQGALNAFLGSLAKVDSGKRIGMLTDLFGLEYADDISLLVESLGQYNKAQGLVANESQYAGSMQREFEARLETTTSQVRILGGTLMELGNVFGNVLLPPINTFANILVTTLGPVAEFAQRHETLTTVVVGLAAGLITARIATFGLSYAWTFARGGALGLAKVVTLLTSRQVLNRAATEASTTATRRMGMAQMWAAGKSKVLLGATRLLGLGLKGMLVGTGIGAVLVLLGLVIEHWDTVKAVAAKAWEGIKAGAVVVWEAIKPFAEWTPLGLIIKNWEPISEFFGGFWTRLKDDAAEAWEWIASKIGVVGNALKKVPFIGKLFGDEEERAPEIGKSVKDLPVGRAVSVAQPSPDAIPVSAEAIPVSADAISAGGVTINYAPTFHIAAAGDPAAVRGQVEQAMATDRRELERMIRSELRKLREEERRLAYR